MKFKLADILLLGLLLLAFALRMYRLDFFSLRGDESFTVLFVEKPLAQMWEETLAVEPNPPLMYFLLRGWIAVTGDGEFATRFFSAFFGVLCVPLVYRLARLALPSVGRRDETTALVAAFLITINPYQIWHSQDVRNYTLWPTLSLLALVLFWKWYIQPRPDRFSKPVRSWLVAFVLAELAALYTHYYEAFLLLALNVFVFLTLRRGRKKLIEWIGAQIVLAVLYLPYPLILSNRVSAYGEGSGRQGVALWDIARETFTAFTLSDTFDATLREWVWIPLMLVVLASLILVFARDRRRGLFFLLYAGVPTLGVFLLNIFRPLYLERYLNAIAPAYYLLLAYGIVEGARGAQDRFAFTGVRRAVIAIALAVCALLAWLSLANYWTNPAYAKAPDWRGLAKIIETNAQRGDIIVQNFPETSLVYYDQSKLPLVVYPKTFFPDEDTTRALFAMSANYQRVWFIPAAPDFWDPDHFAQGWLDHHADLMQEWDTSDFDLRLYATPERFLNTLRPSDALFGNVLRLIGYRTESLGSDLRVVLYWRALQTPNKSFEIEVGSSEGATVKHVPVRGAYPTTEWRKNEIVVDQYEIPHAASAKEFTVRVCDSATNACLPLKPASASSDILTLPIVP
ncbi:MAG TPA: glycosyltransferase family 39 protein [Anaerolineae bacterium]|nr:glycosyltransferase family 39 protein [Anaerolineae bacterium]